MQFKCPYPLPQKKNFTFLNVLSFELILFITPSNKNHLHPNRLVLNSSLFHHGPKITIHFRFLPHPQIYSFAFLASHPSPLIFIHRTFVFLRSKSPSPLSSSKLSGKLMSALSPQILIIVYEFSTLISITQ